MGINVPMMENQVEKETDMETGPIEWFILLMDEILHPKLISLPKTLGTQGGARLPQSTVGIRVSKKKGVPFHGSF